MFMIMKVPKSAGIEILDPLFCAVFFFFFSFSRPKIWTFEKRNKLGTGPTGAVACKNQRYNQKSGSSTQPKNILIFELFQVLSYQQVEHPSEGDMT